MNERAGLASNQDYGKDEKSCQKLFMKHNALITDVQSYGSVIEELAKEGKRLMGNEHFDSAAIQTRQVCGYYFHCLIELFKSGIGRGMRYWRPSAFA